MMEKVKYLILGAGPAGLTVASRLKMRGETSLLVLEKEHEAGGLCRSVTVDGSPFDIGGGHFLDVRRPGVNEFLFRFMPESEWTLFKRNSHIQMDGQAIGHPFEANIWQFPLKEQVEYLTSISRAGSNCKAAMPDKFVDWIIWKLGDKIANDYMLPYNQKMFADELNELGTYWLEKLPSVSFEETLYSCLTHKPYGTQPGHAAFYYPKKYGYGEIWRRMADYLGSCLLCGMNVSSLNCKEKKVTVQSGEVFEADCIITTVPWKGFDEITGMPEAVKASVGELKSSGIETRYVPDRLETGAQWIYIPDPGIPYHRILVRHNFCEGSKGYWLETREERTALFSQDDQNYRYLNEYAYPLNTVGKPQAVQKLLNFCRSEQIYGLGRWGEHSHYNSDLVVEKAMELAESL